MERTAELLEQMRYYRPSGPTEAAHRGAFLDLLSYSRAPFLRSEFVPGHITASCFIVDPGTRRLLLHRHRRLNRWLQMGGHVEGDESAVAAALREGAEESGLDDLVLMVETPIDIDVHTIPEHDDAPEHAHFDVRYLARTERPDSIAAREGESDELVWVSLDDAVPLMSEEASTRAILKIKRVLSGK